MSASGQADALPAFFATPRAAPRRGLRQLLAALQRWMRLVEGGLCLAAGAAVTVPLSVWQDGVPLGGGLVASVVAALLRFDSFRLLDGRPARRSVFAGALASAGAGAAALWMIGAPWRADLAWAAGYVLGAGLLLALFRTACAFSVRRLRAAGRLAAHVAVVGAGPVALRTAARLRESDPGLVTVWAWYAEDAGRCEGAERARGDFRTLLCDCRLLRVDSVVLALEPGEQDDLLRLRHALRTCVQDVYLSAELMEHAGPAARAAVLGATPLLLLGERPQQGLPGLGKVVLDQAGAWLLLAFMAPVLGIIALAIKLESPGPVLFRQLRVGYNNQLFHILKFRSMRHDAADRLAKQQTVYGDARVTRVGRIIRRLSLDELPQLLNVVKGEMSLVGPRPHAPGTSISARRVHHLVEDYSMRHLVRPGITGLAQVRGLRGGLHDRQQVADRLAADLEYVRTWSLWLDIKILALTLVLEWRGSHGF